jgi:dihydrofolate synthase/folylpolyglutamate synthase
VIARIAAARGARLISALESAWITRDPTDVVGTRVAARTISQDYGSFILPLMGAHQLDNAAVALRVIEELEAAGVRIGADAVRRGLSSTRWPGRLETLTLRDGREALLDAAHNPAGAAALASYLGDRRERRPLVFAAMRDKDADGILRALAPVVGMVVMTKASNTRSADPDALAATLKRIAPDTPVEVADRPVDALARAWAHAPRIVVAGSIFLLGDVIEAIEPS